MISCKKIDQKTSFGNKALNAELLVVASKLCHLIGVRSKYRGSVFSILKLIIKPLHFDCGTFQRNSLLAV